jgi:flagellar motility protein MotE (MotC chaperone)
MEQRSYGKIEWLFYIIIIPLLFTGLLSGIVLQIMGYDVTGKLMSVARNTPVLSSIVPADDATKQERSEIRKIQSQLDEANKQLEALKQSNTQLTDELAAKDSQLNQDQQKKDQQKKQETASQSADDYWKGQARMYAEMSPKKAAEILAALPVIEARAVMGRMSSDGKVAILEQMDPKIVAILQSNPADVQVQENRSAESHLKQDPNLYSLMAPDKAAAILAEMPTGQAKQILAGLKKEEKAAILEQMDPKKAKDLI